MIKEERKYQAFYTKSTPIIDYMVSKLCLESKDKIFEPCGGDGVFIEAILKVNELANVDICELNPESIELLNNKFSSFPNVRIRQCDTLLDTDLIFNSSFGGVYDKIIANPPYGAWQDYHKRAVLKKNYPHLYTKETYSLFLFRCIELLKEGGILSFIIPDTFLNLHMHKAIRKHILTKTKIIELALFPSSFFPGVNFGYANLSIITLQKCNNDETCLNNRFKIINNFVNIEQLSSYKEEELRTSYFIQSDILLNPDAAFLIAENSKIVNAITNIPLRIGDIANCVTGFYSGDDKTFLRVINPDLRNGKNYSIVDPDTINKGSYQIETILDGISGKQHFLPIVKGGNTKYLKSDAWFMNWSKEAVENYKTSSKARFQNPQYYFKYGIGVPMISSSSITASLIENKLFDQSIVGIFPKDQSLTLYLLGFFNSPTCNAIIRTINPSANNPANYIKKIPFISPNEETKRIIIIKVASILQSIKSNGDYDKSIEAEIHNIFKSEYGF